jgi:hypothetical protein
MSHGKFVKTHMAALAALAAPAADQVIYWNGDNTPALISLTSAGRALLDDANAAAQLSTLGAQTQSDVLDDLASLGANSSDGEVMVGTGAGALAWESGATLRTSLGLGTGDDVQFSMVTATHGVFSGNVDVTGNLRVQGSKTYIEGEFVASAANYTLLNAGYTTNSAQEVGFVANYLPTSTTDSTTGAGVFTAGVDGVSDPTVTTAGSGTFSASDLILIAGSANAANDGLYEVVSHTGTTLTIRSTSNGTTDQIEGFTADQFEAHAGDTGATIVKVTVAVLRVDSSGNWEVGSGSATGISFTNLAASAPELETSRVTGTGTVSSTAEVIAGDTDSGAYAYNLPSSPTQGRYVYMKNVGTGGNDLTVGRNSENIEGSAADYVLSDLESVVLIYDGTEGWMVF